MKIMKLIGIGFLTTALRAMLQMLLPAGQQTVLAPSVFVNNGSMPLAFMVYGIFAYTLVASLFLIVYKNMSGGRVSKGLKFGLSCALVWSVYLLEPLPHVAGIDKITYPLADSTALLFMGLLLGRFLAVSAPGRRYTFTRSSALNAGVVAVLFLTGRMVQYNIFHIYSSYNSDPVSSILWSAATGIVIGLVFDYLRTFLSGENPFTKACLLGGVLFGVNLFAFNFFMPVVFAADIADLFIRTAVDILFVFSGSWAVSGMREKKSAAQ